MITSTSPVWIRETAAKLKELAKLRPNWDSHGGLPLQPIVRSSALQLLEILNTNELPTPALVLGSAGTVQFEWRLEGRELELELLPDGSFAFLRVFPDGHMEEGMLDRTQREELPDLIQWLLHG